jgi:hypothetical protein
METEKEIQRDADHYDAMAAKNDGNKRLVEWTPHHKVVLFGATRSGKSEAIGSLLARVGHKLRELNKKPGQKKKKRRSAG